MNTNSCDTCNDAARERNRSMEDLRTTAKQQAINEKKGKAICQEEATGLFIADAETAIRERFFVKEFISAVQ